MSGEKTHQSSIIPRIKIRIENLSDLVFGLALSIGSLELLARTPQTPADLGVSIALFAFSFFVIVSIWIGYARIMAAAPQETSASLSLNLLLLFCVVLEPYLFFVLQSASADLSFLDWTSFAYSLDVGANFLILGGLVRVLLRVKTDLHPAMARRFRVAMLFYMIIGGFYVVSALPIFWIETPIGELRFVFWYSSFAFVFMGILNRRRERVIRPA